MPYPEYGSQEEHCEVPRLNTRNIDIAVFTIMYTEMPAELQARKAQPFLKACLVPDSSWEFLVQTLDFPCWQPSSFRKLTWSLLNPKLINDCIQNFVDDKDFIRFRDGVSNLKSFNKLIPAIIKIWNAFDEDMTLANSYDDFLSKLTKHVSVQDLVEKYSDRLRAVRGHSVFTGWKS